LKKPTNQSPPKLSGTLVEPDDHVIELYFKDKKIATYNQSKLTIPILHEGCGNYLKSIMGEL